MPRSEILDSLKINGKPPVAHQWDKDFTAHVRIEIECNFSACENSCYVIILFRFNSPLFLQAKVQLKSLVSCNQWEFFLRRTCCQTAQFVLFHCLSSVHYVVYLMGGTK